MRAKAQKDEGAFRELAAAGDVEGIHSLLENVPVELDPVLESVLQRQIVMSGGVATIRVGDNYVEYDNKFRLYITTKLPLILHYHSLILYLE